MNVSASSSACLVRLAARVAEEVREEPLDQPVPADDTLGGGPPGVREDDLLALAPLDQAVRLEAFQHLARRCARDAEHVRDTRGERRRVLDDGPVLADREGEEVDRLEVGVDRVTLALRHVLGQSSRRRRA